MNLIPHAMSFVRHALCALHFAFEEWLEETIEWYRREIT